MNESYKEYIVLVHNKEDLDWLYDQLESLDKAPENTSIFRSVECANRRPNNKSTHYWLSAQEAQELRNNPKIRLVEIVPKELGIRAGLIDPISESDSTNPKKG